MTLDQYDAIRLLPTNGNIESFYHGVWRILFPNKELPASIWIDGSQESLGPADAEVFWLARATGALDSLHRSNDVQLPPGYVYDWTIDGRARALLLQYCHGSVA